MTQMLLAATFPAVPGTYVLWLQLAQALTVRVGRLGAATFAAGSYAYVGSAHGPGGLRARLLRHLADQKALHWHIDALTMQVLPAAIWTVVTPERLECHWAQVFAASPGVTVPLAGFGASDCGCAAHLFQVPAATLSGLWAALDRPATWGAAAFSFLV